MLLCTRITCSTSRDFTRLPLDSKHRQLCRHISKVNAARFTTHFLPFQFEIGGVEFVIQSLIQGRRITLALVLTFPKNVSRLFSRLDFGNMFNSFRQEEGFMQHFPSLSDFFSCLLLCQLLASLSASCLVDRAPPPCCSCYHLLFFVVCSCYHLLFFVFIH